MFDSKLLFFTGVILHIEASDVPTTCDIGLPSRGFHSIGEISYDNPIIIAHCHPRIFRCKVNYQPINPQSTYPLAIKGGNGKRTMSQ